MDFWINLSRQCIVRTEAEAMEEYKDFRDDNIPGDPGGFIRVVEYGDFQDAIKAAKTFQELNIVYRTRIRPSEALFKKLKFARGFLETFTF